MSLSVAALRISTVKAIDAATSAAGRVFDSNVDPVDLIGKSAEPTVVVYTDHGVRRVDGLDIIGGDHTVDLSFELFVAKFSIVTVKAPDGSTEQDLQTEYPATDAAYENRLQRLAYEIISVLTGSASPWAEVWRKFAVSMSAAVEWDRGADAKNGRRFNFLRIMLRVSPLCDPVRGAPLTPPWVEIFALMDADDELSDLARDWRALITTPDLPAWRQAMASLGLTYEQLAGIGLSPFQDHQATATTEASELIEITLDPVGGTIAAAGE